MARSVSRAALVLVLLASALGCSGPPPSADAPEPTTCAAVEDAAYPGTCCSTDAQQAEFVFDEPRCFETVAEHEAWLEAWRAAVRSGECRAVHVGDPC